MLEIAAGVFLIWCIVLLQTSVLIIINNSIHLLPGVNNVCLHQQSLMFHHTSVTAT